MSGAKDDGFVGPPRSRRSNGVSFLTLSVRSLLLMVSVLFVCVYRVVVYGGWYGLFGVSNPPSI